MWSIYAPIVQLMSPNQEVLFSTCTFMQFVAYQNNIQYTYGRYDRKATIFFAPKEVEGVPQLDELREKAITFAPSLPLQLEPEWLQIGEDKIDGNLFSPEATSTAYGFELQIGFAANKHLPQEMLKDASQKAFSLSHSLIVLDITSPIKYGDVIMPVEWLIEVVPFTLPPTHKLIDGFILATVDGQYHCSYSRTMTCNEEVEKYCEVPTDFLFSMINEEREKMVQLLVKLFKRGTIVMQIDSKFVDYWELKQGTTSFLHEKEYSYALFHPIWTNTLITSSPTEYLLEARAIYRGELPLKVVDRQKLSTMPVREAMKYIASPRISTTYRSALEKAYSFYKG